MTPLPMVPAPFQLNATVVSVHDGDSINVIVDWGKRRYEGNLLHPQPIRLLGCNAAELHTPGGDAAQVNLASILRPGAPVVLLTVEDDKFAPRWDCQVVYAVAGVSRDLVADLVTTEWAAAWNGSGPRPVPPWPRPAVLRQHRAELVRAVHEWRAGP